MHVQCAASLPGVIWVTRRKNNIFAFGRLQKWRLTQISYAPKALDRSLAAYLRCDLKANVFCLLLRPSRVFVKAITHVRSFFRVNFHKAHILATLWNNMLPLLLTSSPEDHPAEVNWIIRPTTYCRPTIISQFF